MDLLMRGRARIATERDDLDSICKMWPEKGQSIFSVVSKRKRRTIREGEKQKRWTSDDYEVRHLLNATPGRNMVRSPDQCGVVDAQSRLLDDEHSATRQASGAENCEKCHSLGGN